MDSSLHLRKIKARAIYAGHIARQQLINGGCAPKNMFGTASASTTAPSIVDIATGERTTTQVEHDAIIADNTCPLPEMPSITSDLFESNDFTANMLFEGTVVSSAGQNIVEYGVVWNTTGSPTIEDNKETYESTALGAFSIVFSAMDPGLIYARAYLTTSGGTFYGSELSAEAVICLAEGTPILLADGTTKPIEELS